MYKRLALVGASLAISAALAVPAFAAASSLTNDQVNAIISLLQSFGADSTTIANVRADLGGTAPTPSCLDLPSQLTIGSSGPEVVELQTFLESQGYFNYTGDKGYFGSITAASLRAYQSAHGLSATGVLDAQTRAVMACSSNTAVFSASPTSGAAPLTVIFTGNNLTNGSQYVVDFGDGSNSGAMTAGLPPCAYGATCTPVAGVSHTYTAAGTYTATLEPYIACMWSNPRCLIATQALGTATITVTQ